MPSPPSPAAFSGPYFVVFNAGSGNQDADKGRATIARVLEEAGRVCEVLPLTQPGQIAQVAADAVARARAGGGAVVAAGGDGTINAVAQAVYDSGCPFGVLPLGTFNYFARAYGIPQEIEAATHALLRAQIEPVQAGRVNKQLFLVNASLGLYPQLLEDREAYKKQLGRSRAVALLSGMATLLRERKQLRLQVEADGDSYHLRTPTLIALNNRLQLERLGFAEQATALTRGRLVGMAIRPTGTLAMFALLLRGALGALGEAENVLNLDFRRVTVAPSGRRPRRIKVATDGEVRWMQTPLTFEVAPEPLLLLVPSPADRVEAA